ncbi:hypothetical protein SCATT_28140 [Streptantibioticus cattleyicolor NRRL 8057 = DSM 46488]|uniref:Uncharacterized protein n=1 Tax=Streptantibioticus cattleyicolor (strain ATCC 35852 / DSM 46488 / JCM 4925 / NBRC 14057 / NRRL 8057) TaxID=1003195 RepID=G8WPK3_STREN|nr:hypothetical protein SCATT_28140 [Streptantibioticus cattleyicolor NRRL 8057 = DSM 46488]
MDPGLTAFTRIPCGPSSRASEDTMWSCAALLAPYCAWGPGFHPEIEDTTTIDPPPAARR